MQKNIFITNDITCNNERVPEESDKGYEDFDLTEDFENFLDFVQEYSTKATEDEKKTAKSFAETFPQSLDDIREWINEDRGRHNAIYEEWTDKASHEERYEERYQVPIMNCLRYFPSFVSFKEEDRYKVAGNTCLLYDNKLDSWAVGMTGGGMDLTPRLIDTFINLEKGIPLELAQGLNANYHAYVHPEKHAENYELIAKSLLDYSVRLAFRATELSEKLKTNATIMRHIKGLNKLINPL